MVYFVCDACQTPLKRQQITSFSSHHYQHCSSLSFSCIDCSETFDYDTIKMHNKCISEVDKYEKRGKNQRMLSTSANINTETTGTETEDNNKLFSIQRNRNRNKKQKIQTQSSAAIEGTTSHNGKGGGKERNGRLEEVSAAVEETDGVVEEVNTSHQELVEITADAVRDAVLACFGEIETGCTCKELIKKVRKALKVKKKQTAEIEQAIWALLREESFFIVKLSVG